MATAPIGHNNPPTLTEQALLDGAQLLKPLLDRAAELLATAATARANDADSAGKCVDLVKMIRTCDSEIDAKRKEAQEPYKKAVDLIMDIPRKVKFDLAGAKTKVTGLVADFDKKERDRLKKEADARAEQEKADADALAARAQAMGVTLPPEEEKPEPARAKPIKTVSSDMGSSVHTRKHKIYTITDPYALPLDILNHEKVQEAIISVARAHLQANPDAKIKGIIVSEEDRTVVK